MGRYDDYKLKDLAKNINFTLSGNLFSDVDSIRAQYVMDNAGTVDYPKRELSYDEAYRILEFRKRYNSSSSVTEGDEFGDFSVGVVSAVFFVTIILIVKFFKYPGKWLFVPVLSVVTLLLSIFSSIMMRIIQYGVLPSGKKLSTDYMKFYAWITNISYIWGIVFAVLFSLILTLLLYPITTKFKALIRKNCIHTKGDRIGKIAFLISSIALAFLTIWGILSIFMYDIPYINVITRGSFMFYFRPVFSHIVGTFRVVGAWWLILFVAFYFLLLGILFTCGKEKICALLSIICPIILIPIVLAGEWSGGESIAFQFNSIFLCALVVSQYSLDTYYIASILIVTLYSIFAGITLLKKSEKLFKFTHGLGHLVVLIHLMNLFVSRYPSFQAKSPLSLFNLGGFDFGSHYKLFIPTRWGLFLVYVLLIWSVNVILVKKCDEKKKIDTVETD